MLLKLRDENGDHEMDVRPHEDGWLVTADGGPAGAPAVRGGDDAWLVTGPDGRRRRAWVVAHRGERLVFCDGRVHRLRRPDPDHGEEDSDIATGPDLHARMPGKVVRLLATVGQEVAVGQALVIMESMKMETELAAPVAGRIERIAVAEGQVVAQDDLLVVVRPPAGG